MFAKGYSDYYELFNSDKPYKKEIEFVYKWAGKPQRILDLGCGPAHYWEYFPKETYLMGIEKSLDMCRKSKERDRIICKDLSEIGKYWPRKVNFGLVTALFDVMNYIPKHDWWQDLPLIKDGYFIFDVWDADKVKEEGFQKTVKKVGSATRTIEMLSNDWHRVLLMVKVEDGGHNFIETHTMYLHSEKAIREFCGNDFEIVEIKPTAKWQTWYKLKRK